MDIMLEEADSAAPGTEQEVWSKKKCVHVVKEIFKTEKTYIETLKNATLDFQDLLPQHLNSDDEKDGIIPVLFQSLLKLYNHHTSVDEELRRFQLNPQGFGQVFVSSEEQFKAIYTEYITVYEEVLHQENVGEMLPRELQSKLIKPVQRMVQYHMLLERIVKLLDQDFHGYQSLQSAKATMEDVANSINEVMKEKKKLAELIRDIKKDIQKDIKRWAGKDFQKAFGKFVIQESECTIRGKKCRVVLFEKILLIVKQKDGRGTHSYMGHIPIQELVMKECFCEEKPTMSTIFKVSGQLKSQEYEIDAGSRTKQQEILGKMKDLLERRKNEVKRWNREGIDFPRSDRRHQESSRNGPLSRISHFFSSRYVGEGLPQGSDVVKLTGYKKRSPECDGDVLETLDTTPDVVNEDFPDGGPQESETIWRIPIKIDLGRHESNSLSSTPKGRVVADGEGDVNDENESFIVLEEPSESDKEEEDEDNSEICNGLTLEASAALPPLLHHRAEDFNCLLTFIQEELERESDMEDDHLEAPDETSSNDVRDKYDECTSPQRGSPTENSHKAETNINTDSVLPERHSDGFYVHWLPSRSGLIAIGVAILASIAIYYVYS